MPSSEAENQLAAPSLSGGDGVVDLQEQASDSESAGDRGSFQPAQRTPSVNRRKRKTGEASLRRKRKLSRIPRSFPGREGNRRSGQRFYWRVEKPAGTCCKTDCITRCPRSDVTLPRLLRRTPPCPSEATHENGNARSHLHGQIYASSGSPSFCIVRRTVYSSATTRTHE